MNKALAAEARKLAIVASTTFPYFMSGMGSDELHSWTFRAGYRGETAFGTQELSLLYLFMEQFFLTEKLS